MRNKVFDSNAFQELINSFNSHDSSKSDSCDFLDGKTNKTNLEERVQKLQNEGRTDLWFETTSKKLQLIFTQLSILRSNQSVKVRFEFAKMCCELLQRCPYRMGDNFVRILETIIAMTEDEDLKINSMCKKSLNHIQYSDSRNSVLFDETASLIFDEHLIKLPRIINRCDENEQYSEFLFLKGFFRSLSDNKLQIILITPRNLEMLLMCLISAFDLKLSSELLTEEYALRDICDDENILAMKISLWRKFKNINSDRTRKALFDICGIIGNSTIVSKIVFDELLDMISLQNVMFNEVILLMTVIVTMIDGKFVSNKIHLSRILLEEVLKEYHWYLSLQPDEMKRLKVHKVCN